MSIPSVITLGTFDGVHRGHQSIIKRLLEEAGKRRATPIVVTFHPHPSHVLTPDRPLKMINSLDERLFLLRKYGVEHIHVEEFTKDFASISARDYIEKTLLGELNMKMLLVGYDHGFGKDKGGDFRTLQQIGKEKSFDLAQVPALKDGNTIISSTQIRQYLSEGKIEAANHMLGHVFCLFGTVVRGNRLGRKIGFETANIILNYPNKLVPAHGVYIVRAKIENEEKYGIMNIGNRPTVSGTGRTIEAHFLNLNKNLYDKQIRIFILHRIRDEKKFDSLEALKNQLLIDRQYAENYIENLSKNG